MYGRCPLGRLMTSARLCERVLLIDDGSLLDIRVDGLGFLPLLCVPHHDVNQSNGLPRSLDSDCMMLEDPEQLCLGIDENAALVIENETVRVISGDDIAQCYLKCCIRTEDGYDIVAHAISESHASIPLVNLLSGNVQWDNTSPTG